MTEEKRWQVSFIDTYPTASFFILALALGAGTIMLVAKGVISADLAIISGFSASLAGIIMTAVMDGKTGLKLMFSRLLIWRVGIGYWLFALLFLVPVILLGLSFNPLFNGELMSFSNLKPAFNIVLMFLVFFIVAGIGQELGWTGFLTPRLQTRFGALTACLIRAVLTGIWYLPLLIYAGLQPDALPSIPYGKWIAQKGFLVIFTTMTLMMILPWSIFFTWIFNNTKGSLLLVAVLHGSEIWLAFWMLSTGITPDKFINYWGYEIVMVLAALLIVIITGPKNLSRRHKRIVHRPMAGKVSGNAGHIWFHQNHQSININ
jgi:membrane protease YdiL (CAAX protease family)